MAHLNHSHGTPPTPSLPIQKRIFDSSVTDQRSDDEASNRTTFQGCLTHREADECDAFANSWSYNSNDSEEAHFLDFELPISQRGVSIRFDRELPDPADKTIDYPTAIDEYINSVKNEISGERILSNPQTAHLRILDEPGHPLQEPSTFWTTSSPSRHESEWPPWNNREYQECLALIDNPNELDLLLGTPFFVQRFVRYLQNHHDEISLSLVQRLEREFAGQSSPLGWNNSVGCLHHGWIHIFSLHLELIRFAPPVVRGAFWSHTQENARGRGNESLPSDSDDSAYADKENWDPAGSEGSNLESLHRPVKTHPSCHVNGLRGSTKYSREPTVSYNTGQTDSPTGISFALSVPCGGGNLALDDMLSDEADKITNYNPSPYYIAPVSQTHDESDFYPDIEHNVNGKRQNGAKLNHPNKAQALAGTYGRPRTRGGNNHMYNKWPQCRIDMFTSANRGKPLPAVAKSGKVHPMDSVCTPEVVDIRFLGQHDVTAVEIATFFPKHTAWRAIMNRYVRNGWESGNLVKFILYSRGIQNTEAITASALSHAKAKAIEWATATGMPTGRVTDWTVGNISADRDARGINKDLIDYRIADLARGVQVMPSGEDRQILTAAVELARQTNSNALLSQFSQYVGQNWSKLHMTPGIVSLSQIAGNVDVDGLGRVMGASKTWARQIGYKRR